MKRYVNTAILRQDSLSTGNADESVPIRVFIAGSVTVEASLFSDVSGTTPIVQPFTSDLIGADMPGQFSFYVEGGLYDIYFNFGTGSVTSIKNQSISSEISIDDFGALGGGTTDDSTAIQLALDTAATLTSTSSSTTVICPPGKTYVIDTGLVIPPKVLLDLQGSLLSYTGTGVAVTLGNSDSVLSHDCSLVNFRMHLIDKASTGVRLRGTRGAAVRGNMEGIHQPFDNTRTNIGVDIDGVNISTFFNIIEVNCSHMHESFRVGTTGTTQPTPQYFLNCSAFGDQSTDDSSIGYNFQDTSAPFAEGTVISGGNIELCNIGIYFGQNARGIEVNTRFEITSTATSRALKYSASVGDGIVVNGRGFDAANIGAVSGGIEGLGNGANTITDFNGNTRTGGNDSSFSGLSAPIRAFGEETLLLKSNGNTFIKTTDNASGTGRLTISPTDVSSGFGAFIRLHAAAHASKPKDCDIGPAAEGTFRVQNGIGGNSNIEAKATATATETGLLVYDVDNATVERVTVGIADSGGVGFKVLRIQN